MLWKGMPLLALDGTTFKAPARPENRRRFGLPGSARGGRAGYPLLRSVALVSPFLRFVLGARFGPYRRGELDMALSLLPEIPSGSMLVMDRARTGPIARKSSPSSEGVATGSATPRVRAR